VKFQSCPLFLVGVQSPHFHFTIFEQAKSFQQFSNFKTRGVKGYYAVGITLKGKLGTGHQRSSVQGFATSNTIVHRCASSRLLLPKSTTGGWHIVEDNIVARDTLTTQWIVPSYLRAFSQMPAILKLHLHSILFLDEQIKTSQQLNSSLMLGGPSLSRD
jgi:hypothetical protein